MKKSKINLTALIVLFSGVIVITACQKNNSIVPSPTETEFTSDANERLMPPTVPPILEVPVGNSVFYHVFASGVQIYVDSLTPTGWAWVFKAPEATLYKRSNFTHTVGTHYAGPTWANNHGSTVKAMKLQGADAPDPTIAIPWLLLQTVLTTGTGKITDVTYIQRVNTTGGLAPTTVADAAHAGEQALIPYTAEYFFYRAD